MTRKEVLLILLSQAQGNGFDFRNWFQANVSAEWSSAEDAAALLSAESRFYCLVFSHDFARAFWKRGAQMRFIVPSITYSRMNGKGEVVTVNRKPFTRRTIKPDVWKYHLREMAVCEDPFYYLKRFMPAHDQLHAPHQLPRGLAAAG